MTRRLLAWLRAHPDTAIAYLATVGGILADPELLNIVPPRWSHGIVIAGVLLRFAGKAYRALRAPAPAEVPDA